MNKTYVDMVHTLLHLLCEQHDMEPGFIDVSELSNSDKAFMLITSCAELQASMIWTLARGNRIDAEQGLELLVSDLKKNMEKQRDQQQSN